MRHKLAVALQKPCQKHVTDGPRAAARGAWGCSERRDRRNLCFILRGIPREQLRGNALEVTIENPAGGPYASHIFAIYVVPDDATAEDEAQRLIEQEPEAIRSRALGFAEYAYRGERSNEGFPLVQAIALPMLVPVER